MARQPKTITKQEDLDFLFGLKANDVLKLSFVMDNFGDYNGKCRFNVYDNLTVPPNTYGHEGHKNKNSFKTTVGIWVFNKAFIEEELFDVFGYINHSIDDDTYGSINDGIAMAILEDRIPLQVAKNHIKRVQKCMPFLTPLSASFTLDMLLVTKKIEAKKKELVKKYRKELDAGNDIVCVKIQDELMALSKELLKDDPSLDLYNSGASGSFGNNYKNLFVMKGVIKDPDPNKGYNIVTSSLMEGVKADEYSKFANSLAAGPYARAKKTELGGYWEKLLLVALQHLTIVSEDCHTKRTIEVHLTKKNYKNYIYSFIVDNGKLVEFTSDKIDKYLNKTVKFRFASLCEEKKGFCQVCCGNLFKRINIKNVGAATPQVASKLKNISMKAFHDSQVKEAKVDYMKAFGLT